MRLALFDLDHTLVPLDTGELWVRWLLRESGRDAKAAVAHIERFTREYRAGALDIDEFMDWQLGFLASFKRKFLDAALRRYLDVVVRPNIPEKSRRLVARHRDAGDVTALCTATYSYVTEPVAEMLGIDVVLASRPAEDARGEFNGKVDGTVTFQKGKVVRLQEFLTERKAEGAPDFDAYSFYSDSMADRPMFEFVESKGGKNFVVNGEPALVELARGRGWTVMSTFGEKELERIRRWQAVLAR